jgi:hypothetical protein
MKIKALWFVSTLVGDERLELALEAQVLSVDVHFWCAETYASQPRRCTNGEATFAEKLVLTAMFVC